MNYNNFVQAIEVDKELCTTIAMEELAELIQAISKAKRGKLDKGNLSEEICDVMICIEWLCEIYEISDNIIDLWLSFKTNRIVERLNKGDFN